MKYLFLLFFCFITVISINLGVYLILTSLGINFDHTMMQWGLFPFITIFNIFCWLKYIQPDVE